jgi:hypothetical protein
VKGCERRLGEENYNNELQDGVESSENLIKEMRSMEKKWKERHRKK